MTKIHGKSVLLGIGIGTVLTALLGLIFFLGYKPEADEAKVREMAEKIGMVDPMEAPNVIQASPKTIEVLGEDSLTAITQKLVDAGMVQDPVSFQIKAVNQGVKDKIVPGWYEFKGDENEQEIINILTSQKE